MPKEATMFSTIIVPLEASAPSDDAVRCAAQEARQHGAKLMLVRVIPRPEPCPTAVSISGPAIRVPVWVEADVETERERVHAEMRRLFERCDLPRDTIVLTPVGDPFLRLSDIIRASPKPLVIVRGHPDWAAQHDCSDLQQRLILSGKAPVLVCPPAAVRAATASDLPSPAFVDALPCEQLA
jgi:nucleotide-binding universal stress UspA family protein